MKIPMLKVNLTWIILIVLSCACSHLVHLDRAQYAFNQAATLENAQRFDLSTFQNTENPAAIGQVSESSLITGSPEIYYNRAYAELNNALKNRSSLEKDSVLATALTLQALTEWKLGKYQESISTADEALMAMEATGIQLPRDKAVMTAMRGLVAMDLAYEAIQKLMEMKDQQIAGTGNQLSPEAVYQNAKEFYQNKIWGAQPGEGNIRLAMDRVNAAKAIPGDNHPVQGYLVLSQLAGLKTWGDSIALLLDFSDGAGQTDTDWIRDQYCVYHNLKNDLGSQLRAIAGDAESKNLIRRMNLFEEPGMACN